MGHCETFRRPNPPRLLKDLLREDSISTHYSKPPQTKKLIIPGLLRNMVNLALKTMKNSPSVLHRSLSCSTGTPASPKLLAKSSAKEVNVTVKDIIRWKSFRDLQEEEAAEETTSATSECSSSSQSSGSKGSSWCESDFSSEWWWCQPEILVSQDLGHCKKSILLLPPPTPGTAGGENDNSEDEQKQHKNPFQTRVFQSEQEEDDSYSNSDGSLTNSESPSSSTGDSESEGNDIVVGGYEGVFAKAWELLEQVMKSSSGKAMKGEEEEEEELLLDFFTDELIIINRRDDDCKPRDEMMIVKEALDWVNSNKTGTSDNMWGSGLERKNDGYVKAMDEEGHWGNFGGGNEVGLEVEAGIFGDLITELLLDIS